MLDAIYKCIFGKGKRFSVVKGSRVSVVRQFCHLFVCEAILKQSVIGALKLMA